MVQLSFHFAEDYIKSIACVELSIGELTLINRALESFAHNEKDISIESLRDACNLYLDSKLIVTSYKEARENWIKGGRK